jgi:hypothetical protein
MMRIETKYFSDDATFFHGSRDGELMTSRFRLWRSHYDQKSKRWTDEELQLAYGASYLAHIDGTGATQVRREDATMAKSKARGTSRAAMHAFFQALHSKADPFTGGPPQLVGLWRKGLSQQFGIWWYGKSYVGGMEVPMIGQDAKVNWFNHLFERCDGKGKKLRDANSHRASLKPRPAKARQ